MNNDKYSIGPLILLFGAAGLALWAGAAGFTSVQFTANSVGDIINVFLTLIVVALIVERAVEVFVNNQFGRKELEARRDIRIARAHVDIAESALSQQAEVVTQSDTAANKKVLEKKQDELWAAKDKLKSAQEKAQVPLENLIVQKRAWAGMAAILLGLFVAAAGIRIFSDLAAAAGAAPEAAITNENQLGIFRAADIFLTALLLAGGADGLHQIVKRFIIIERDLRP